MEAQTLWRTAHQLDGVSTDRLERFVVDAETAIGRIRANQMTVLAELERRQVPHLDGCRTLHEWVASRLDVAPDTATTIVTALRHLPATPTVSQALENGEVSFDRAALAARAGDDDLYLHLDLSGVARATSRRRALSRSQEQKRFLADYLVIQPTLDGDTGRIHGTLSGGRFRTIEHAFDDRAEQYRTLPDGIRIPKPAANAHALEAMAQDSLHRAAHRSSADASSRSGGAPTPPPPVTAAGATTRAAGIPSVGAGSEVTVFVDATDPDRDAVAHVEYGPRVGPAALESVLCTGRVRVVGIQDGAPVVTSQAASTIPPAVRHFVAMRDDGCCADGCTSRYRLQPHHVTPRSRGGPHHPANLRTLCWFHHHLVVHRYEYQIDPASPPGRTRFRAPP